MLCCCWSVKGGSGCSTVAAALALEAAVHSGGLLVDLRGDIVPLLGLGEPDLGLGSWSRAYPEVATDSLTRLEVPLGEGAALLPLGSETMAPSLPAALLAGLFTGESRTVVADCGTDERWRFGLVPHVDQSILVLQPCYVSCARAVAAPTPGAVVTVRAPWHAISDREVAAIVGAPVIASIPLDRSVATATDAGLFLARTPRVLRRALAGAHSGARP